MSENPLDPSSVTLERIRIRAYHLWEQEGRPEGRAEEYWERARELQAMQDSAGAAQLDPAQLHEVIDEAELQENLGEFPDRLTDQGDRREVPMTKTKPHTGQRNNELG